MTSTVPAVRTAAVTKPTREAGRDRHDDVVYVGLVTRAIAFAIDSAVINGVAVVVVAIVALASLILPIPKDVKTVLIAIGGAGYILWTAGYFVSFWATDGRTLGNRVMYIRVVPADGGKLGYGRAVRRLVGLVLAVLPLFLGLAGILLNERRRGFADRVANTVVVHDPERREPNPGTARRLAHDAAEREVAARKAAAARPG
jgi:uncharacterized RDD family membrane protein YckC